MVRRQSRPCIATRCKRARCLIDGSVPREATYPLEREDCRRVKRYRWRASWSLRQRAGASEGLRAAAAQNRAPCAIGVFADAKVCAAPFFGNAGKLYRDPGSRLTFQRGGIAESLTRPDSCQPSFLVIRPVCHFARVAPPVY
jgi:hypothetical protein